MFQTVKIVVYIYFEVVFLNVILINVMHYLSFISNKDSNIIMFTTLNKHNLKLSSKRILVFILSYIVTNKIVKIGFQLLIEYMSSENLCMQKYFNVVKY